jgi:S-DNA-T family DNA segregation ATPase FtsK/SpoIIIE
VLCFVFCLLTAVALIDYGPEQSSHMTSNPTGKNLVGWMGSEFSYWTYYLLGYSAAFFPVFLAWMTYLALRPVRRFATTRNVAMLVAIFCFSSLAEMASDWIMITRSFPQGPGGLLGKLLYENILKDFMGVFGAGLMLAVLYTLCLMFVFTRDIGAEFDKILLFLHEWKEKRAQLAAEKAEQKKLLREQAIREKSEAKAAGVAAAAALLSKDKPEKKTDEVTPVPSPTHRALGQETVPSEDTRRPPGSKTRPARHGKGKARACCNSRQSRSRRPGFRYVRKSPEKQGWPDGN